MTLTVELEPALEQRLREEAERTSESVDTAAHRVLASVLLRKPFAVEPTFNFQIPERFKGMTPMQIDSALEDEHFMEKLERSRH